MRQRDLERGPAPPCRQGSQLVAQHQKALSLSPVAFAGPGSQELLETAMARSGRGEEAPGDSDSPLRKINCWALQEVYHCHPRLAASHLLLRLPARSACHRAAWGARAGKSPPAPFSTQRASGAAVEPACRCEGEAMVNYLPSAHPGSIPIHQLGRPWVRGVPDLLLGWVTSSSASVPCPFKASVV